MLLFGLLDEILFRIQWILYELSCLLGFFSAIVIITFGLLVLLEKRVPKEVNQSLKASEEGGGGHGGCSFCGKLCTLTCGRCNAASYCSGLCQREHWISVHKYECVERETKTDHQKDDVGEQARADKQTTMPYNDGASFPLNTFSEEETSNPKPVIDSYEALITEVLQDSYCTVKNWFGLSMGEFSLLSGSSPGEGTTNLEPWIQSCEVSQNHIRNQTPEPNDIKWELIWKLQLPATLISFLRSICMNALSLGDKDTKSNIRIDGRCPFGCPVAEDPDHLFMRCPFSRAVWFGSTLKLRVENISPASIQLWILSILVRSQQDQTGNVKAFLEWITCVCWCIYEHRNAVIFHHEQPSPVKVLHHLSALMKRVNNIHHKPAQPPGPKTVFKTSPNSQEAHEQTDEEMGKYLEEKLAKSWNETVLPKSTSNKWATRTSFVSRGLETFMEASDEPQFEFSKAKREFEDKQERVQKLELELEEITKNSMRKVEEIRVAQRKKQEIYNQILEIAGKARDAERIQQEDIIQTLKSEYAKLKRELEEERKLVQRLKLEQDNEAHMAKRKVEKIGQELANARKNVEYVSSRADVAENKLIKAKIKLQEKQQLVQLLKVECEETRQSGMRQVEEKELQLANALNAIITAKSRALAAEAKLFDLEKEIKSSNDKACVICLNNEKDMAFGCGHMTCRDCGLIISICPICRKQITNRLRLFLG